jgi:hypothetical protein
VVSAALVCEPWSADWFAAVLASAEIADQVRDLVQAEDRLTCVVGVAAWMSDLVWLDCEHRLVADQTGGHGDDHDVVLIKQAPPVPCWRCAGLVRGSSQPGEAQRVLEGPAASSPSSPSPTSGWVSGVPVLVVPSPSSIGRAGLGRAAGASWVIL